jgi:hypothetical protein
MLEGGEPIMYEGQLVGAIGVSGANLFKMLKLRNMHFLYFLHSSISKLEASSSYKIWLSKIRKDASNFKILVVN